MDSSSQILHTFVFESFNHNSTILKGLNELRKNNILVDVALFAEGRSFKAHRVVLSSCSDYFRAMFSDFSESKQDEIILTNVSALGIELLLEYIYTSKLQLNLANIQDVLSAANYIQVESVIEACLNYLDQQLDLDNYIDVLIISELYSLKRLNHKVYRFICHNLDIIARSTDFLRLSKSQIEYILKGDYPVFCSEVDVLKILLRWIQQNCDNSENTIDINSLIAQCIRFSDISMQELYNFLGSSGGDGELSFNYINKFELFDFIMKTGQQKCLKYKPQTFNKIQNYRGLELAIIKIGGFDLSGITNEITYLFPNGEKPPQQVMKSKTRTYLNQAQPKAGCSSGSITVNFVDQLITESTSDMKNKWRYLTTIPHIKQSNFGAVVLNNELYVIGGCYDISLQEYIHPFGFKFCPIKNSWNTIAPLQQDRCRFSLNVIGHSFIAIGGNSEMDNNENEDDDVDRNISTCEQYDPVTDKWTYIDSLPEYRTQHSGASYGTTLYVSGGLDIDGSVLSTLWSYCCFNKKWKKLPNMLTPRADHVMITINRKLYVCGGWYEINGQRILADSIDCYDIFGKNPHWYEITKVPTPKYHAGIVAVNEKIYIIGGFCSDDIFRHTAATIECYDVDKNKWFNLDKYPKNIWEHTCANLYIPKYRDDMEVLIDDDDDSSNTYNTISPV